MIGIHDENRSSDVKQQVPKHILANRLADASINHTITDGLGCRNWLYKPGTASGLAIDSVQLRAEPQTRPKHARHAPTVGVCDTSSLRFSLADADTCEATSVSSQCDPSHRYTGALAQYWQDTLCIHQMCDVQNVLHGVVIP